MPSEQVAAAEGLIWCSTQCAFQGKHLQEKCEHQPRPMSTGRKTVHTWHLCHLPSDSRFLIASLFPQVFPLFHALGANGLLLEYEDMFPYEGHLRLLRAKHAYRYSQPRRKRMCGATWRRGQGGQGFGSAGQPSSGF